MSGLDGIGLYYTTVTPRASLQSDANKKARMLLVLFTNQNLSKVAKFLVKVYIFMFFSFLTYDLKFKFPQ